MKEIIKIDMIEEFEVDNSNTTRPDDESIVLSKVESVDGVIKYEVQFELGGVAGHTENEYFETERQAREYIDLQI